MSKKTAVITGASRGIGLAIAKALLEKNYKVYGICRHQDPEQKEISWITCDVSLKASVERALNTILEETGQIDILVNNAGMGVSGAAEFTSAQAVQRQLHVNLEGVIWCTQAVIPSMRKAGGGKILFVSSLGAIFPLPYQSFYSVSKAGMNVFSDALGIELKPFHIQTCALMLNDVKTEFTQSREKSFLGDDVYQGRIKRSVSKMEDSEQHGMRPEAVARLAVKLLEKDHMPAHATVGFSNKLLVFLYHILPTGLMLKILGKIYG